MAIRVPSEVPLQVFYSAALPATCFFNTSPGILIICRRWICSDIIISFLYTANELMRTKPIDGGIYSSVGVGSSLEEIKKRRVARKRRNYPKKKGQWWRIHGKGS